MAATATAPATATPPTTNPSHPYTCNTCQVAFKGSVLQRGHMQSDWHRYNLKRRVASLPPLTSEVFAEKVLANQASAAATAARASFERVCAPCQRTYFSENAYQNHLQSQKHKIRLMQLSDTQDLETEGETESIMSSAFSLGESEATSHLVEDNEAESDIIQLTNGMKRAGLRPSSTAASVISTATRTSADASSVVATEPSLQCLFCNTVSSDLATNLAHMRKTHGLFIPEQAYLVDLPGLVSYLYERVHKLHECLFCGQLKHTTSGIQTHMRDKGHCMIAFESEEQMIEVGQFYDFSSTYSDDEDESEEEDGKPSSEAKDQKPKLGAARKEVVEADSESEEEWESDEEDEEDEEDDNDTDKESKPYRPSRSVAYEVDGELVMPSGRTAGHRAFARYFRQNLHNYPSPAERIAQQQLLEGAPSETGNDQESPRNAIARRRNQGGAISRGGGGLGLLGASDEKKREASQLEFRGKVKAERAANRYRAGNEKRANAQKHFRDPLLQ